MGKVLQIRVTSCTWHEDLVEREWPRLAELAFSVPIRHEKHGVMDMVKALHDGLQFMDWPGERRQALAEGIRKAAALKADMEKALADWDPRTANRLSDALEEQLDILERKFV